MDPMTLAALAIGLGMDATAVAAAAGLSVIPFRWRPGIRLAFHFGFFQALLPVAGWLAGKSVRGLFASLDHWIAFALLLAVGGRMILDALRGPKEGSAADPSRGVLLLFLSIAVSIDALAVGMSLALLKIPILFPAIVFGVVTLFMSLSGFMLGSKLGTAGGKSLKVLGGLILMVIGIRIILSHF